jgi:hypothetical protein
MFLFFFSHFVYIFISIVLQKLIASKEDAKRLTKIAVQAIVKKREAMIATNDISGWAISKSTEDKAKRWVKDYLKRRPAPYKYISKQSSRRDNGHNSDSDMEVCA